MPDGSGRIVISVYAYQLANWPRNPINSDVTIVSEWDFRNLCLKSEEGSAAPAGK